MPGVLGLFLPGNFLLFWKTVLCITAPPVEPPVDSPFLSLPLPYLTERVYVATVSFQHSKMFPVIYGTLGEQKD